MNTAVWKCFYIFCLHTVSNKNECQKEITQEWKRQEKQTWLQLFLLKKNKRIQNFPTKDERKTANPQERKATLSGPLKRNISRKTISPSRRKMDHKAVQSTRQQGEHQHLTVRQGRERRHGLREGRWMKMHKCRQWAWRRSSRGPTTTKRGGGGCWGGVSTVHEGDGQDDRYRLRTGTKRKVDLRQYTVEDGCLHGGWVTRKTRIKPGRRGRGGRQRRQTPEGWTDSPASQPSSGRKDLTKKTKLSPK